MAMPEQKMKITFWPLHYYLTNFEIALSFLKYEKLVYYRQNFVQFSHY